ncbi:hypothetical protein B0H21DRAFT_700448 [Amylocystis lapponica]|nr:hypothetical protein B0H21DRAFT_700448 [Amylocystis lapponica]
MGWDTVVTHITYGERFRQHRWWIHDAFEEKASLMHYRPLQVRETLTLLSGLAETPEQFMSHFKRQSFAAAVIVEITYGHSITSVDDPFIKIADRATSETVRAGND